MNTDLEALLALQAEDETLDALEERLRAIGPRAAALDRERDAAAQALARTTAQAEADEKRRRDLEARISDHRQRHQRNLAHLETAKKMREATAAMAQVEQARKVLADEESELQALTRRIADAHKSMAEQQAAIQTLDQSQEEARAALAAERTTLEEQIAAARATRGTAAERVPRSLLGKYERIRGRRRSAAVHKLRNHSCGNCDTTIPLQRRSAMMTGGAIEVCEVCGVLLYASV